MGKVFQVDSGTLLTSLISYWKLDDVNDFYSTNHFTNGGSVAFNSGKVGSAADFGTSNLTKYLRVASNLGIDGGNMSMSCWVNVSTAVPADTDYIICNQGSTTSQVHYAIFLRDTAGVQKLRFIRTKPGVAEQGFEVNNPFSVGTWYHVALTYDGTNVEGWVNGVSQGISVASGSGSTGSVNEVSLSTWRTASPPSGPLSGLVDEFGIWSKKLSNADIADLYNSGSGQTMRNQKLRIFMVDSGRNLLSGLISYYKLENVYDFYGTNHLTNVNTVTFPAGKVDKGGDFESSSSQDLNTTSSLGVDGGACSFAFSGKVESNPGSGGSAFRPFKQGNNISKTHYVVDYNFNDTFVGQYGFYIAREKPGVGGGDMSYQTQLSLNTWYHFVYTYDGTTEKFYIDNSEVASAAVSGNGSATADVGFSIGGDDLDLTTQRFWDGMIDEFGVWSRALSIAEISDLYNGGFGQTMLETDETASGLSQPQPYLRRVVHVIKT